MASLGGEAKVTARLDRLRRDATAIAAAGQRHALGCLAVVVILMITGWVPNVQAAFIGVLLMMATGCIDITSAYRCINWKTIVLIVGMLPFSIALQRTGGVDLAANALQAATAAWEQAAQKLSEAEGT